MSPKSRNRLSSAPSASQKSPIPSLPGSDATATGRGKKRGADEVGAISGAVDKRQKRKAGAESDVGEDSGKDIVTKTLKRRSTPINGLPTTIKSEAGLEAEAQEQSPTKPADRAGKSKRKAAVRAEAKVDDGEAEDTAPGKPAAAKRKTKEEREAEAAAAMPLAPRAIGSKLVLGAHVSGAGGVHNAVSNAVHIGANAFALFLKSQRKWANPPLQEGHRAAFLSNCKSHNYDGGHVVPHGSYLVNLAHPDPDRSKQAYDSFHDDLSRCHKLGIKLYNFHPGNSAGAESRGQALSHLASQLNKAHADPATGNVVTLLETMATRGNAIGGTFEDLHDVIEQVERKDRVGVCLDTCHVFAAGYDIRTPTALSDTLDKFDDVIGLEYLKALHVNDSKAPLGSCRDLHANIGHGFLGLRAFHALVNEPRLQQGLPMILETPIDRKDDTGKTVEDKGIWASEITLLQQLLGMDAESDAFKDLEKTLFAKGESERERIETQVKKKAEKDAAPKGKGKRGSRKKAAKESESDEDGSCSE